MSLKNLDRRVITILLIVFVQMVGAAMILPILPLYAKNAFALEPQTITLLVTVFFAAQFVAGPYLGRLSDHYGRVPVLIVSQIGTVLSFIMLGLAPNAGVLFAARILDGITGGNIIVAQAYMTDITPREKRTESLGYILAVFGIGFIIGPGVGGLMSAAFGPRVPYLVAAGVATLTVLLTWFTLTESLTEDERAGNRSRGKQDFKLSYLAQNYLLVLVLTMGFVGQFAFGLLVSTFALYGEAVLFADASAEMASLGVGLLLTAVGMGQFFTQTVLLRRLLNRYGDVWLVIIGSGVRSLSFFLFAVITSPWLGAIGSILFAMGAGLMMPPLQSLATKVVDDSVRGGILGVAQSVNSLGTIISTAVAGVIFAVTPTLPFWIGGVLSLGVLIPAFILLRQLPESLIHAPRPKPASGGAMD